MSLAGPSSHTRLAPTGLTPPHEIAPVAAAPTPKAATTATPAAVRRTPWLFIATAALIALILTLQQIAQSNIGAIYQDPVVRLTSLAVALTAVGLFALYHYQLVSSLALIRIGMGLEILVAFWIALVETAVPLGPADPLLGMSAVGPWIVFACVLAPNRAAWTLGAGLAAASMWPLAYAINVQRFDIALASWPRLIVWPGINYLMAIVACLLSRRLARPAPSVDATEGLGAYRLLTPIGEGGMGEVWEATHQMLARKAAIKLVRPKTSAPSTRQAEQWVRRFHREANVIAGLQSPHTIYLYDFGVSRDGQFYYVMELLDGVSLQALVTNFGPQLPGRVRHILLQVCESLEEAHQQSLVHRDLKPSNVMLCKLALNYDFVKVLDFGLAKCAACEDATQLTMEGVYLGTPGYIAPEVALGELEVDGRADIYALGCVAYYLLTGTLVFPESNPMTMALKHVQAKPEPPSTRTELPIPAELEQIVMQCLEKNPSDRPASVREVAALLARCDLPPWTHEDAAAWWERHLPQTSSLRSTSDVVPGSPPAVQRV